MTLLGIVGRKRLFSRKSCSGTSLSCALGSAFEGIPEREISCVAESNFVGARRLGNYPPTGSMQEMIAIHSDAPFISNQAANYKPNKRIK